MYVENKYVEIHGPYEFSDYLYLMIYNEDELIQRVCNFKSIWCYQNVNFRDKHTLGEFPSIQLNDIYGNGDKSCIIQISGDLWFDVYIAIERLIEFAEYEDYIYIVDLKIVDDSCYELILTA